jgi:hypothetical protein
VRVVRSLALRIGPLGVQEVVGVNPNYKKGIVYRYSVNSAVFILRNVKLPSLLIP